MEYQFVFENNRLSLTAKGIYSFFLSKLSDFPIELKEILSLEKDSKKSVFLALKELEKEKLIEKMKGKDECVLPIFMLDSEKSKKQIRCFDINVASSFGISEAIIIDHFQYEISLNRINGKNINNGVCWSNRINEKIIEQFEYWDYEEILDAINNLRDFGIIKIKNYNESNRDRNFWCSFVDSTHFSLVPEFLSPP